MFEGCFGGAGWDIRKIERKKVQEMTIRGNCGTMKMPSR